MSGFGVARPLVVAAVAGVVVAASLAGGGPAQGASTGVGGFGLDTGFGVGGSVTGDFHGTFDFSNAVVVQGRKIVVAGSAGLRIGAGQSSDFGVMRYNGDGSLDVGFGGDGKVTTDFFGSSDVAYAMVTQPDRRVVVAGVAFTGQVDPDFALARYQVDGSLDASFGVGGKVTTDLGGDDRVFAMVRQADGRFVVAGSSVGGFTLVRYEVDGSLDDSFGSGGRVTTRFGDDDEVTALAVQPDGKLIAAGSTSGSTFDFAVARYNTDGSLDRTFGTGGKVATDFGGRADRAAAIAVQADGKLVAAGELGGGPVDDSVDTGLARYNPNGTLDRSFGSRGRVVTDFAGGADGARALVMQGDKILAGGYTSGGDATTGNDFAVTRYRGDGVLDTSFGTDGRVRTDFDYGVDQINAMAVQGDSRLVAVGVNYPQWDYTADFRVVRYRGL